MASKQKAEVKKTKTVLQYEHTHSHT